MASPISTKICSSCNSEKPVSAFGKRPEYRDGYRNQCNPCRSASTARYSKTEAGVRSAKAARAREKANRPPSGLRWSKLRTKYGITQEEYETRLERQGLKCAVCRSPSPKSRRGVFVVDHCHYTGRVRGLLCTPCNTAIGNLGDTLAGVEAAANYLRGGDDPTSDA